MSYRIAVVGATGNVGQATLQILSERNFPIDKIYAVASDRSNGIKVSFGDKQVLIVNAINGFDFKTVDLAFFCTSASVSREFVPKAVAAGCKVIDKSSEFRLEQTVSLIVPEINGTLLQSKKTKLVANPNCVAIPLALALQPLHENLQVKRVVISTYQSVSGAGREAMDELHNQTRAVLSNQSFKTSYLPRQIAFNLIPQIDAFNADGFTQEEAKIMSEIRKIISPKVQLVATCVRVPVFIGHCMSVNVEFNKSISVDAARDLLAKSPGLMVVDRPQEDIYVTPLDIVGEDVAVISRIRIDPTVNCGLAFWISCDNLRKGAALNSVQIAEQWLLN